MGSPLALGSQKFQAAWGLRELLIPQRVWVNRFPLITVSCSGLYPYKELWIICMFRKQHDESFCFLNALLLGFDVKFNFRVINYIAKPISQYTSQYSRHLRWFTD